ncbi:MAG: hypothetical protein ABI690_08225 [Chloroflexota bacterium]
MRTVIPRMLMFISLLLLIFPLFALAQSVTDTPPSLPTETVTTTPFPTPLPLVTPAAQQLINIGSTIAESLPAGTTLAAYYFEGRAGQYVSISLDIALSYTKLQLLDSGGLELARGDFDGAAHRMEITAAKLPKDGTYTLAIERSEGLNTFTLNLKNLIVGDIAYGQVIDALLTIDQTAMLYRFRGSRFDVIDVSLLSTEFDPYVRLLDSSGHQLTGDDNDGGGRNAFFGLKYLWEDADYLIHVSSKNELSTGAFQLRLNRAEFTPLHFDDTLEVDFTPDAPVAYFEFKGSIGDVVNLSVQSDGTLDTVLQMAEPDYMPSYQDDDGGAGFDPEIASWSLPKDGTYRVLLRPYLIGSEGQVTLTLSRANLSSLDSGTQEILLTEKNLLDAVSFTGRAGESVRLTIAVDPLMDNPPQVEVIQNGQTLASSNGSRPTFTLDVTIPADGLVVVQVRDIKSGPGTVQLSIERGRID